MFGRLVALKLLNKQFECHFHSSAHQISVQIKVGRYMKFQ